MATPLLNGTLSVPPSTLPAGFPASDTLTLPVKAGATLPKLSSALTTTVKASPAVTPRGWLAITRCVAAAVTLKVAEFASWPMLIAVRI
jgi:hypothetical protein